MPGAHPSSRHQELRRFHESPKFWLNDGPTTKSLWVQELIQLDLCSRLDLQCESVDPREVYKTVKVPEMDLDVEHNSKKLSLAQCIPEDIPFCT